MTRRWAYYNEVDPFAAAWLRQLIKAGAITDGEVDERDVRIVQSDDVRGFVRAHFFAGIGGWDLALQLAGWPADRSVWTGSCPCQPFSSAGKRQGGADDRHLWPHWARLIRKCRPDTIVGEQVESAIAHGWLDLVFDDLGREGYACGAACAPAASVGAPHIRQRLWFVAQSDGRHAKYGSLQRRRQHGLRAESGHTARSTGDAERAENSVADAEPQQHRGGIVGSRRRVEPANGDSVGELADAEHAERRSVSLHRADERDGEDLGRPEAHGQSGACGEVCELADAEEREAGSGHDVRSWESDSGHSGELGHACIDRHEGCADKTLQRAGRREEGPATGQPSRSPWADLVWLPCRDGKARPTQPGLFPLAHGVSARVGRLRGYGNAIVPQVAAAFIGAYLEVG